MSHCATFIVQESSVTRAKGELYCKPTFGRASCVYL